MTRHPTARRVRHTETSIDDAFVARAFEASTWASRNRQLVITGSVLLVLIVAGLLYFMHYRSTMAEKAMSELTRVRATAQSGNTQLAIADLEKYIDSFGGTETADEARLMLAQQYLLAGSADKAVQTLEKLGGRESTVEGAQAAFALAEAYEASGAADRAETIYQKLGTSAPFLYLKQDGLDNLARLQLARGDATAAVTTIQKILDMTPEVAPERDVYQLRLGEAQAAAGTTAPAAAK